MDYWPLYTLTLLLIWRGYAPLSPLYWSCQVWWNDQWCCYDHIWGRGLLDVPWTSPQMFWLSPLCILHHTPTCHICICKLHHFCWLWHQPIHILMAITSAITNMAITSAKISIGQWWLKHQSPQHQKVGQKHIKNHQSLFIWLKTKFKIIYNNIPHTPSKVGVMARIIFSFTLDEAMSVGLTKACALRKIYSVTEKTKIWLNIQTEWETYMLT